MHLYVRLYNDHAFFFSTGLIDSIARSDLDLKKVADNLGSDWPRVAPFLGLSEQDVSSIRDNETDSDYKMALTCLTLWQERNGSAATGKYNVTSYELISG